MKNERGRQTFETLYHCAPQGVAEAPGRVNLIGEFTDYNQGFVLPCALNFSTRVWFRWRTDDLVVVQSLHYPGQRDSFSLAAPVLRGDCQWGNYIRAVAFAFQRAGHALRGVDLLIDSTVPQGSGLSSSAALEVAVAGVFDHVGALGLSPGQLALLGQQAENDFMACQCGIMDQLISATGLRNHALLIDCDSLDAEPIAIPDDLRIVIVNSNYPRKLVDSEYNQRRVDCEAAAHKMGVTSLRQADMAMLAQCRTALTPNQFKRARHVISENSRVLRSVAALRNNDMDSMRQLMDESHQSLRDDFEVTVPATDGLVAICRAALGDRGAVRMTGGGFGGAIVCLCREDDVEVIRRAVGCDYQRQFALEADIHICQAGAGLAVVEC